ncbi:MAG: patatin-like phospholipase family protein [Ginsengibacter sp.]
MKRALVVSGGGSKGAFAVGVLKDLVAKFPNLDFDIFVGTSAGSIIVTLASLKQYALLEEIYTTTNTIDILQKFNLTERINESSLFDVNRTLDLIERHYPKAKFDQLLASNKKVFLTTTCLQTGELTVFATDANSINPKDYTVTQINGVDHYRRAVLASCCIPVFMPPIKVNIHAGPDATRDLQYADGGVLEYAGVQMAIDAGATEIFVILLNPGKVKPRRTDEPFAGLFDILLRTIDLFGVDVGKNDVLLTQEFNAALTYINAVKEKMVNAGISRDQVDEHFRLGAGSNPFEDKMPLKIFTIRPADFLGGGPGGLDFIPGEMQGMLASGELRSGNFIASLEQGDITWG